MVPSKHATGRKVGVAQHNKISTRSIHRWRKLGEGVIAAIKGHRIGNKRIAQGEVAAAVTVAIQLNPHAIHADFARIDSRIVIHIEPNAVAHADCVGKQAGVNRRIHIAMVDHNRAGATRRDIVHIAVDGIVATLQWEGKGQSLGGCKYHHIRSTNQISKRVIARFAAWVVGRQHHVRAIRIRHITDSVRIQQCHGDAIQPLLASSLPTVGIVVQPHIVTQPRGDPHTGINRRVKFKVAQSYRRGITVYANIAIGGADTNCLQSPAITIGQRKVH